mgnify:CR=1 FL=1
MAIRPSRFVRLFVTKGEPVGAINAALVQDLDIGSRNRMREGEFRP